MQVERNRYNLVSLDFVFSSDVYVKSNEEGHNDQNVRKIMLLFLLYNQSVFIYIYTSQSKVTVHNFKHKFIIKYDKSRKILNCQMNNIHL